MHDAAGTPNDSIAVAGPLTPAEDASPGANGRRFTLAHLFLATALAAATFALVRNATLPGVLTFFAGSLLAGAFVGTISGRPRGALTGAFVGALVVCLPFSWMFWPPALMLAGAGVGAIAGAWRSREREPRTIRTRVVGGGAALVALATLVVLTMDYETFYTSTCSHCRATRVRHRWYRWMRESVEPSELTAWYAANLGPHDHDWGGTSSVEIRSLFAPSDVRPDDDPLATLSPEEQLAFFRRASDESRRRFLARIVAREPLARVAAVEEAKRFLAEGRDESRRP